MSSYDECDVSELLGLRFQCGGREVDSGRGEGVLVAIGADGSGLWHPRKCSRHYGYQPGRKAEGVPRWTTTTTSAQMGLARTAKNWQPWCDNLTSLTMGGGEPGGRGGSEGAWPRPSLASTCLLGASPGNRGQGETDFRVIYIVVGARNRRGCRG